MHSLFTDMPANTGAMLVLVAFTAFVAGGFVKGALGLGLPVSVVSIMSLTTDIRTAAMLVLVPVLATNLWQCMHSKRWLTTYRQYWRLTLSMSCILLLTSFVSVNFSQHWLTLTVGVVVVLFAVANLWLNSVTISLRWDTSAQYATGLATGILGGLSGLIVVPLAIYFTARNLNKELFIASTAPFFFLGAALLCIGYGSGGALGTELLLQSVVMVIPAIVGLLLGERARQYIPEEKFRSLVLIIFMLTGFSLIQSALTDTMP